MGMNLENLNYKSLILNKRELCDFELIINSAFNPLKGFMNKDDYESCVNNMRLKNGDLWSMPITLSINEKQKEEFKHSDYILLKHETGLSLGLMNISNCNSIYKYDLEKECINVYGKFDDNHPYVKILKKNYDDGRIFYIGGHIEEFEYPPHYDFKEFRFSPQETKNYFRQNGWSKII